MAKVKSYKEVLMTPTQLITKLTSAALSSPDIIVYKGKVILEICNWLNSHYKLDTKNDELTVLLTIPQDLPSLQENQLEYAKTLIIKEMQAYKWKVNYQIVGGSFAVKVQAILDEPKVDSKNEIITVMAEAQTNYDKMVNNVSVQPIPISVNNVPYTTLPGIVQVTEQNDSMTGVIPAIQESVPLDLPVSTEPEINLEALKVDDDTVATVSAVSFT